LNTSFNPEYWNQRYREPGFAYGQEPNEFLVNSAHRLRQRGSILLPGDGEGRNGVWLARQGHEVTSVDMSSAGCDKARALAASAEVSLNVVCADLLSWTWPINAFDAVVVIFLHVPANSRQLLFERVARAVAPGGIVVLELFEPLHISYRARNPNVGGPGDPSMLVSLPELRTAFAEFDEIEARTAVVDLKEGRYHRGTGAVVQAVFRKGIKNSSFSN
jgi:SAM-dependent methyltransferase